MLSTERTPVAMPPTTERVDRAPAGRSSPIADESRLDWPTAIGRLPAKRLPALTSLRFVAAALIVVLHTRGSFGIPADLWEPFQFDQAVGFFFVLSGFLLAHVYPSLRVVEVGRFLLARFARVWPAHVATFVLVWLLLPAPRHSTSIELAPDVALANLILVHGWLPFARYFFSFNAPSWSISTELAFYLCFPLLIANWPRTWLPKLALTFLLVVGAIGLGNTLELPGMTADPNGLTLNGLLVISPLARLFEFTLGMATALLWRQVAPRVCVGSVAGTGLEALAIGCVVATMCYGEGWAEQATDWFGPAGSIWLSAAGTSCLSFAGLILIMALERGLLSALLALSPLVLLGEISYSVYLLHQVLLRVYVARLEDRVALPDGVALALFWAATLSGSLLMWLVVERPLRRWIVRLWPGSLKAEAPLDPMPASMPASTAAK